MEAQSDSGNLVLESGVLLGPGTRRNEFLRSAEGAIAKTLIRNEPWVSYQFLAEDGLLSVAAFFNDQTLQAIHLAALPQELASEWSMENEHRRKLVNDNWLRERGFEPGHRYVWGSVWSGVDPKGCAAYVILKYDA
jgi:hypothetical protein